MDDTSQVRSQVKLRTGVKTWELITLACDPSIIFIHPCLSTFSSDVTLGERSLTSPGRVMISDLLSLLIWTSDQGFDSLVARLAVRSLKLSASGTSFLLLLGLWPSPWLIVITEYVFFIRTILAAQIREVMSFTRIMFAHFTYCSSLVITCVTHTQELSMLY